MDQFTPSRAAELAPELSVDRKDRGHKSKRAALRKVVINMTMNNLEMMTLFPEVTRLMSVNDLEIKKMCFLFLETYAKARPEQALAALSHVAHDTSDPSPLVRALALRTLAAVPLKRFHDEAVATLQRALGDTDAYVRRTAAFAVAKTWSSDHAGVEAAGHLRTLNRMLLDSNPSVAAAAVAALSDVSGQSRSLNFTLDRATAFRLAELLPESNEWSQVYILQNLTSFVPQNPEDAAKLITTVLPRLQHANTAVVLGAIRLIVYLMNYVNDIEEAVPGFIKRFQAPLVLLLTKPAELQYIVLRNCILLLQSYPGLMQLDIRMFFSKFSDPLYIKTSKIEILYLLSSQANAAIVMDELRTWATDVDVEAARRAIHTMARLALKVESITGKAVAEILDLLSSGATFIVQESTVALQLIARKYKNWRADVLPVLFQHKDAIFLDDSAKAALVWFIGEQPTSILDAAATVAELVDTFTEEALEVQLVLLTTAVKLFMANPKDASSIVPHIYEVATQTTDNPDLRDRAFMYWRLLSADTNKAREIVLSGLPPIESREGQLEPEAIEDLLHSIGYLSSVYLKPATDLFRLAKPHSIQPSPALAPRSQFKNLRVSDEPLRRDQPAPPPTRAAARLPPQRSQGQLDRSHSIILTRQRPTHLSQLPTTFESPVVESPTSFSGAGDSEKLIDI